MNVLGFKMSGRSYLSPSPRFMFHWYPLEGEISIRVQDSTRLNTCALKRVLKQNNSRIERERER